MDDKLEEKLVDILARVIATEKIAERACAMAQEALIKAETLKALQEHAPVMPQYPQDVSLEPLGLSEERSGEEDDYLMASPFAVPGYSDVFATKKKASQEPES